MSEGAYERRGLYPRGLINGGAYVRGGLTGIKRNASKRAIAALVDQERFFI